MKYMEELKKIFGQIMNTRVLVIIFIVGIGLMILPGGESKPKNDIKEEPDTTASYKAETEQALERILSTVKGVGKTEVMVTLENNGQIFYVSDTKSEEQKKDESSNYAEERNYIMKNNAEGGESPVVMKRNSPSVSGVLIIASGAGDTQIKTNIIHAVRALLGVQAHRIEVLERK